ncbi:CHAT domain-containing protein [Streptomyces millisiae]|uniref:CHAT domain-containing protein n=1 Tax=Streptomyces millisiae TaxID=3075542 RepID=A0ABU2LN85_9ACTN|nr:CHAT domain-containing protein [Streptomyces sp. DSM 44918]MDT0318965.1 CHAT domain-containing protein [Streptomyces sp. DSM 44918]
MAGVEEALRRADDLLPRLPTSSNVAAASGGPPASGATDPGILDSTVRELAEAEARRAPDDPGAATLRARLGCLYGKRYLRGADSAGDREEGIRLLRAVRGAAGLGPEDRFRVRLTLALLLSRMPQWGPNGEQPGLDQVIEWSMRNPMNDARLLAEMAEAKEVLAELRATLPPSPLDPELSRLESVLATFHRLATGGDYQGMLGFFERTLAEQRDRVPDAEQTLALLRTMRTMLPTRVTGPTEPPPAPTDGLPARSDPASEEKARRETAAMLLGVETQTPGLIGTDQLGQLVELLGAAPTSPAEGADASADVLLGGLGRALLAVRTGQAEHAVDSVAQLRRGAESLPPDHELVDLARTGIAALPMLTRITRGGNIQDIEAALRRLAELAPGPTDDVAALLDAPAGELLLSARLSYLFLQLAGLSGAREDVEKIDEVIRELLPVVEGTGLPPVLSFQAGYLLALAHLTRASVLGLVTDVRRAVFHLERLLEGNDALPPTLRTLPTMMLLPLLAFTAQLERDPERLVGVIERFRPGLDGASLAANQRAVARALLALALSSAYELTGDRAHLDDMIHELERGRAALAEGGDLWSTGQVLWQLAEAYGTRGDPTLDDRRNAIATGLDALRVVGEDVLMQLGAEHGLQVARDAASRALRVAAWSVDEGDVEAAVAALEAGRALVLRAAAASSGVPEQLAALGHRQLAEQWRRAVPEGGPWPGGPAGAEGPRHTVNALLADVDGNSAIPSTLRRRALDALRQGGDGRRPLLSMPGVAELLAGLADCGADALVYLIPGDGDADGAALVLDRAGGDPVLRLPGLSRIARGPLEDYLRAGERRSTRPGPEAEERWEAALDELCSWAGRAVVGPLLDRLGPRDAPPRVVLVPCGNLGVVPWHAARLRSGFALARAVFSYAASGAQFLDAARRRRLPPRDRAVLVADPRLDLLWASEEVTTLRDTCYEEALLYGGFLDETVRVRGPGTPDELLGVLPGAAGGEAASLLHIASHGSAGPRPTVSALDLAESPDGPGTLSVTRILDRTGGPGPGERGPLVVLSACETDLSQRDHDEALTLTTAFVARGAADVVGTRWTTRDGVSALLMAVFHHHLTAGSLAPADALRAAQLWMLDPARQAPPGVSPELRREVRRPSLGRIPAWAAFIHQGSPRPFGPAEGKGKAGDGRAEG